MQKRWAALALIATIGFTPSRSKATPRTPEGVAMFMVGLYPSARTDSPGCWTVNVRALSFQHPEGTTGTLRIAVGPGAAVVEGESVRVVHPTSDPLKRLLLRRTGNGPVQIRGSLLIPGANAASYDYCESVLDLSFDRDSVIVRSSRIAQTISVRDGQRFRYGGEYLVAIEEDEREAPQQFLSRAEAVSPTDIPCPACGMRDTVAFSLVVSVGKGGNVTWVRPGALEGPQVSGPVWAAAVASVKKWRFRPAMSPLGPIADYAVLHLRVVPSR